MTDEELLLWLRIEDTNLTDFAADRIEALTKERDQHWDSFVHWHKQADDLTGQLAAARQDAKEAEVYAEEVEKERDAIDAKLAQAVKLIDLAVELARWDRAPKLRDDMIDFTTEIKGESHE